MEWQGSSNDLLCGIDDGARAAPCPLCDAINTGTVPKCAELMESNGKLE